MVSLIKESKWIIKTVDHFRKNWFPDLTDRKTYEVWVEEGKTRMGERTKTKIRTVLDNHRPQPLPGHVMDRIDEIIKKAEEKID